MTLVTARPGRTRTWSPSRLLGLHIDRALDIYSGYFGIDDNLPERLRANAAIAGAADRVQTVTGDMRDMPLGSGRRSPRWLEAAGFEVQEAGTKPAILYLLARNRVDRDR